MTRLTLALVAILVLGSPSFAQQLQQFKPGQAPNTRQWPSPQLRGSGRFFAEPIPAWNIHGHAEAIPTLPLAKPLETKSWKHQQPIRPVPESPRAEKPALTSDRTRPPARNSKSN